MPRRLLLVVPLLVAAVVGGLFRVADQTGAADHLFALQPISRTNSDSGSGTSGALPVDVQVEVARTARPGTLQAELDRCQGPVAVRFAGIRPALLAEHDYCGGLWVLGLDPGEVVRLTGAGLTGTYRVTHRIKVVPEDSSAAVLRGMGEVVAQTCRPDGRTVRLVGLSRIG